MSIRTTILLPLMAFMVLAGILSGATGLVGLRAIGELSSIADRTSDANDVSRRARDRFRAAEAMLTRVTAMTDLIDMAPVQAEFATQADELTSLLGRLADLSASERMRMTAQAALAESRQWRTDAETLLGIRAAAEIPTVERMSRRSQRLRESFDRTVTLAREEGRAGIQTTRDSTEWTIWAALGLAALLMVAGAGTAWWLARSLSRPLVQLTTDATRLASGDTSVQLVTATRRDEIGDIARAIVQIRDLSMEEAARQLTTTEAVRLREEEARRTLLRDLADRFEHSVGAIVIHVSEAVRGLQGSSGAMRHSVEGTAERSASAAGAARQTSENVTTVAVAAEEIRATVGEIGRQVEHASGMSASAVQAAARTQGSMAELSAAATRIGDVIGLVSTIAGQTNLLALNATIEAARAGAAGRGFAVVAAEVKELAGQTSRATEEIVRQVAAIQAATGGAAHAIQDISAQINAMNGLTAGIAAAVEQQNATAQEIARSMTQASDGTDRVTVDISEVARSAGEAGLAATAVARAADDLAGQSGALRAEVEHFLANVRAA